MTTYEVWICDAFGVTLDVVDDWLELEYTRVVNDFGALKLVLNGTYNTQFIKTDGRIFVWRNGKMEGETAWLIRRWDKTLDKEGVRTITITAVAAIEILSRRIVAYDSGTTYTDKTGAADNVMKQIVRENFSASATDSNRDISSYLAIDADNLIYPGLLS